MKAQTKVLGVASVASVATGFGVRDACAGAGARACTPAHVYVSDTTGDTGDTGDTLSNSPSNKGREVSPVVSPVAKITGDTPGNIATNEGSEKQPYVREAENKTLTGLDMPVYLFASLPVPSAVRCVTEGGAVVWLCAARRIAQEARGRGEAVFGPVEYAALAVGLSEGRCGHAEVAAWVARKLHHASWQLRPIDAVAGAVGLLAPAPVRVRRCTMGWLVQAMGLRAVELVCAEPMTAKVSFGQI